jgi:hypothetical protein
VTHPAESLTAAAVAIHDVDCPDRTCSGPVLGHCYKLAEAALNAATPLIAAAADERAEAEAAFVARQCRRMAGDRPPRCRAIWLPPRAHVRGTAAGRACGLGAVPRDPRRPLVTSPAPSPGTPPQPMTADRFRAMLTQRLRAALARDGKVTPADLDLICGDAAQYAAHVAEQTCRPWPWPPKPAYGQRGYAKDEAS